MDGIRERARAAQWAQERARRREQASTPPRRRADEFAEANPATLTGRLISKVAGVPYEERLARFGEVSGQFRGSETAKRRMRRGLSSRLRGA